MTVDATSGSLLDESPSRPMLRVHIGEDSCDGSMASPRERAFDNEAFFAALNGAREARKLTWKQLAQQAGVSASTLTRMGQGKRPDVDSFAALAAWAGVNPEKFVGAKKSDAEPLAEISVLLRRDPHLNAEAAAALDELLKATYRRLRQT
jgi:transcriptional regulator with XRE-family HTH domain